MRFSNPVDIANGPPLPPSKQCWNEETNLRQGKVYSPAQTTTLLGGWGKRGGITADHISCPKSFVPHCSLIWRLIRGNIIKRRFMSFAFEIYPITENTNNIYYVNIINAEEDS